MDALRYKLSTFGIPIDGLDEVIRDNQLLVNNLIIPTSTLKKMHNVICSHWVKVVQVN